MHIGYDILWIIVLAAAWWVNTLYLLHALHTQAPQHRTEILSAASRWNNKHWLYWAMLQCFLKDRAGAIPPVLYCTCSPLPLNYVHIPPWQLPGGEKLLTKHSDFTPPAGISATILYSCSPKWPHGHGKVSHVYLRFILSEKNHETDHRHPIL